MRIYVLVAAVARRRCCSQRAAAMTTTARATSGSQRREQGEDRPAAAGDEDRPLRDAGPAAVRGEGQGALPGLRGPLLERRPGRRQAAAAGRGRAHQRRQGARARPGRRRGRRGDRRRRRSSRSIPVISYDRLMLERRRRLLHLVRQRRRSASCRATALVDKLKADGKTSGTIVMINGAPTDNNAKLFKQGAHSVLDGSGFKIGKEYDTPDWTPGQGPDGDGAGDHRARQERVRRRLRRQRRHRRRRDRGDEGRRHRPATTPDHRPGRRARRHPAHPRRRAVHDGLQGDQAGGRGRRAARGRAASSGKTPGGLVNDDGEQRHEGRAVGDPRRRSR